MRRATVYGCQVMIHLDAWPRHRGSARRASFPHADPTSGDSAPAAPHSGVAVCSAPGHRLAPALATSAGTRTPQRAPQRTPSPGRPCSQLCSGRSRHGVASLSVRPRFSPGSPPLTTNVATPAPNHRPPPRPASPHASLLHVSTRAATDHPPTDCDRPQTTCPFSVTTPIRSRSRPGSLSLACGQRFHRSPHLIGPESCGLQQRARWTPRVDRAEQDANTRPDPAGTDGHDAPDQDHVATTVPVEARCP
ncbi:hypothetical protein SORBI_3003G353900 [Sorghum bicolor]|uniref:Uncharacterized protein n=1 Tax=Sorghum bicolor TaxID=4558 RepID=A0A1B6Q6Y3_SORBI|nr:hypothetical protein SORBI_3003G353900 [Sorghum bicolor]